MSILKVTRPYPFYFDQDGSPLDNGYVYIGVEDTDPIENPIEVFWDEDMCCAAPQPIRTLNGFAVNNGIQADLYVKSSYSIRVEDKAHVLISYIRNGWGAEGLEAANLVNGVRNSVGYQTADEIRALPVPTAPNLKVELYGPQGGVFVADLSDTSSTEEANQGSSAGILIVSANGVRYKRDFKGAVFAEWFGAVPNDDLIDDTDAFIAALKFRDGKCGAGEFLISGELRVEDYGSLTAIKPFSTTIKCDTDAFTGNFISAGGHTLLEGFTIKSTGTVAGTGIKLWPQNENLLEFTGYITIRNVNINGFNKGLDINNIFHLDYNVGVVDGNNFGIYCNPQYDGLNTGLNGYCTTLAFNKITIGFNALLGVYLYSSLNSPNISFNNCSIEGNDGEQSSFHKCDPLVFENCYFEGNSSDKALSLSSCDTTINDAYFNGTGGVTLGSTSNVLRAKKVYSTTDTDTIFANGGAIQSVELDNCRFGATGLVLTSTLIKLNQCILGGVSYPSSNVNAKLSITDALTATPTTLNNIVVYKETVSATITSGGTVRLVTDKYVAGAFGEDTVGFASIANVDSFGLTFAVGAGTTGSKDYINVMVTNNKPTSVTLTNAELKYILIKATGIS